MKRLTLLTILLVVVGLASGFALELKPGFTLSANAKVSWGINLDTMATGFKNAETIDAYVWLFADETTDTHQGEGDWYGVIKVKDLELFWYTNEAKYFAAGAVPPSTAGWSYTDVGVPDLLNEDPDLEAKIVGLGGKLAFGVYSDPDLGSNVDFVASLENDDKTLNDVDWYTLDDETSVEADLGVDYSGPGTYVSYAVSDALMVAVEIVSNNDWTVDDSDAYAMAIDVLANFAPLTITAGVNYGFAPYLTHPFGAGLKAALDSDKVDLWVGFDASIDGAAPSVWANGSRLGDFDYEIGGGVTITLYEVTTLAIAATYGTGWAVNGFQDFDLSFVFTEPAAKGLVDNLDLTVTVYLLDLGDTPSQFEYEAKIDGGPNFVVDIGEDVNVGSAVSLNPSEPVAPLGEYAYVTVGVDWKGIPLTTFGVYYVSGNLMAATPVIGRVEFSAKVTY